jgi:3-phenylpropionate/trans-cinnamate dioxygenase ferredoxin subunit
MSCEQAWTTLTWQREVAVMLIPLGEGDAISAGEMRVVDVAGTRVNVTHIDDHFYAFEDTCTHMGCSLANGKLDGTVVTCACHGSQFDVTSGAVLRGPAQRPVRPIPLTVQDGQLLAEAPEPSR